MLDTKTALANPCTHAHASMRIRDPRKFRARVIVCNVVTRRLTIVFASKDNMNMQ